MSRPTPLLLTAAAALLASSALAHHTYAMFDQTTTRSVDGSVARLQWINPHAVVWIYVPSAESPGKYDLWKFENDSPSVLTRAGWSSSSLPEGTKVTVQYFPLRDGSKGGHWVRGVTADGSELVSPSSTRRAGAGP